MKFQTCVHTCLRLTIALALLLAHTTAQSAAQAEPESAVEGYRGKVVLLDFWASWCGPCRRSFPWMNQLRKTYSAEQLAIIAVNLDQQRAQANRFLRDYPAHFDIWFDPEGVLAKRYNVAAMPTSIILDRNGNVVAVHRGFLTKSIPRYESVLQQALTQPTGPNVPATTTARQPATEHP